MSFCKTVEPGPVAEPVCAYSAMAERAVLRSLKAHAPKCLLPGVDGVVAAVSALSPMRRGAYEVPYGVPADLDLFLTLPYHL